MTAHGEGFGPAAPKWTDVRHPWQTIIPKQHLEIINGSAEIKELGRTTAHHEYIVAVPSHASFKENTVYFPGWTVKANNQTIPINYQTKNNPGIMTFSLKKGLYKVDVDFKDTPIIKKADTISLLTLIILLLVPVLTTIYQMKLLAFPKR